jgi:hypothetical protein
MIKITKFLLSISICIIFLLSMNNAKSKEGWVLPIKTTIDGRNVTLYHAYNFSYENTTPNYQIIAMADKSTINGGESFTISFQISGNGKIVSNKLITYFPKGLLKDEPKYQLYIGDYKINNSFIRVAWYDEPTIETGTKEGAFISLVNGTFMKASPNIDTIYGEQFFDGHRPINIKANSSENVPAGDHIIKIQFDYTDGVNWSSSQAEVTIHIKSWAEQNELLVGLIIPFVTAIIGAFIGFFLGLYTERKKSNK